MKRTFRKFYFRLKKYFLVELRRVALKPEMKTNEFKCNVKSILIQMKRTSRNFFISILKKKKV